MSSSWTIELGQRFPHFSDELTQRVQEHGSYTELSADTEILRKGQYVQVIPLVLEGLIRVYSRLPAVLALRLEHV